MANVATISAHWLLEFLLTVNSVKRFIKVSTLTKTLRD